MNGQKLEVTRGKIAALVAGSCAFGFASKAGDVEPQGAETISSVTIPADFNELSVPRFLPPDQIQRAPDLNLREWMAQAAKTQSVEQELAYPPPSTPNPVSRPVADMPASAAKSGEVRETIESGKQILSDFLGLIVGGARSAKQAFGNWITPIAVVLTGIGYFFLGETWRKRMDERRERAATAADILAKRRFGTISIQMHSVEESNGKLVLNVHHRTEKEIKEVINFQIDRDIFKRAAILTTADEPFPLANVGKALDSYYLRFRYTNIKFPFFKERLRKVWYRTEFPAQSDTEDHYREQVIKAVSAAYNTSDNLPRRKSGSSHFEMFGILVVDRSRAYASIKLCTIARPTLEKFSDPEWVANVRKNSNPRDRVRVDQLEKAWKLEEEYLRTDPATDLSNLAEEDLVHSHFPKARISLTPKQAKAFHLTEAESTNVENAASHAEGENAEDALTPSENSTLQFSREVADDEAGSSSKAV